MEETGVRCCVICGEVLPSGKTKLCSKAECKKKRYSEKVTVPQSLTHSSIKEAKKVTCLKCGDTFLRLPNSSNYRTCSRCWNDRIYSDSESAPCSVAVYQQVKALAGVSTLPSQVEDVINGAPSMSAIVY